MGVWIETASAYAQACSDLGHTLYGCVDWNTRSDEEVVQYLGHTLYGCVDWNRLFV